MGIITHKVCSGQRAQHVQRPWGGDGLGALEGQWGGQVARVKRESGILRVEGVTGQVGPHGL